MAHERPFDLYSSHRIYSGIGLRGFYPMNPIFLLIKTYWMQLAALGMCLFIVGLVGYQRHEIKRLQSDNASLQATIDLTKAIGQAANEKSDRIEQGSHQAAILSTNQYLSDLEKVKHYNETHPVTIVKRVPVGVCNVPDNTRSSEVSPSPSSPARVDASSTDQVPGGSSLEAECRITTLILLRLQDFEREQQAIH